MTEIRPDYYKSGELEAFEVIDAFEAAVRDCGRESDYNAGRQENL